MANLNFLNTTDCNAIGVNLESNLSDQYIKYVLGSEIKDFKDVDKYTIEISSNCCTPRIVYDARPLYQFELTMNCVAGPLGPTTDLYTVRVDGINGNLVRSIILDDNISGAINWPFSIINNELFINNIPTSSNFVGTTNYVITLLTNSAFEYKILFTITKNGQFCDGILSNVSIQYPDLPLNVVPVNRGTYATSGLITPAINTSFTLTANNRGSSGNSIVINPNGSDTIDRSVMLWNIANPLNTVTLTYQLGYGYIYNQVPITLSGGIDNISTTELDVNKLFSMTTILPGVYEIIICEHLQNGTSNCYQNHRFIDCGTLKCEVINKLVACIDSNVMDYYNGLVWGNDCTDTITYLEFCALYEILTIILQSDGCYGTIDECICSDALSVSNRIMPVQHPQKVNHNPCKTC